MTHPGFAAFLSSLSDSELRRRLQQHMSNDPFANPLIETYIDFREEPEIQEAIERIIG